MTTFTGMRKMIMKRKSTFMKSVSMRTAIVKGWHFLSAVKHTLHITFFIIVIGFVLNTALHFVGEDVLAGLILNRPVLGPVLAGVVGLIPNCAASVTITQLYISGVISLGAMMSGLLVGAGVGLLVLFRVNPDKKENLKIVGILYVIGVLAGIVINWL